MIDERTKCEMAKRGEALPWRTPSEEHGDRINMAVWTGGEWRMNGRQPSYEEASPNSTTCDCFVLITKKLVISCFVRLKSSHPFGLPSFRFLPPPPKKKKELATSCCTFSPQCDCLSKNCSLRNFLLRCLWDSPGLSFWSQSRCIQNQCLCFVSRDYRTNFVNTGCLIRRL
jgi:hypothetical protein